MSTHGWKITNRQEQRTGEYFAINTNPVVTVKARALPGGPPFVCLTCLRNECIHTEYVAGIVAAETPETEAATEPEYVAG